VSTNDAAELCRLAETIAREAHAGQTDQAGAPYIEHVARVAGSLDHFSDRAVGWLHDVVEDTAWTREQCWTTSPRTCPPTRRSPGTA
jgi:(p)ppGpp synthase/HD superfamily hydrolase